jgi:putative RecB family exonuclease
VLRYAPDEDDLLATERKLLALWDAIERATQARDFRPRPGRLCGWCDHQALCPSFGGTPPPWPDPLPEPSPMPAQRAGADQGPRRGLSAP